MREKNRGDVSRERIFSQVEDPLILRKIMEIEKLLNIFPRSKRGFLNTIGELGID